MTLRKNISPVAETPYFVYLNASPKTADAEKIPRPI
jgi:hypothetical protein